MDKFNEAMNEDINKVNDVELDENGFPIRKDVIVPDEDDY